MRKELLLWLLIVTLEYIQKVSKIKGSCSQNAEHRTKLSESWQLSESSQRIGNMSQIKRQELMELVETLPPAYEQPVKSGWDMMMEEFMEKGMEKGIALGTEKATDKAIAKILAKFPQLSNQEVAEMFEVLIGRVEAIRSGLAQN